MIRLCLFILFACSSETIFGSSLQRAEELANLVSPEQKLTEASMAGIRAGFKSPEGQVFVKSHAIELERIVKENYTKPFLSAYATYLAKNLSDVEVGEILAFYRGRTGGKWLIVFNNLPQEIQVTNQKLSSNLNSKIIELLKSTKAKDHK